MIFKDFNFKRLQFMSGAFLKKVISTASQSQMKCNNSIFLSSETCKNSKAKWNMFNECKKRAALLFSTFEGRFPFNFLSSSCSTSWCILRLFKNWQSWFMKRRIFRGDSTSPPFSFHPPHPPPPSSPSPGANLRTRDRNKGWYCKVGKTMKIVE